MTKWVQGTVVGKRQWTEDLVTLQVAAPEVTFVAGQFGRLALPAPPGSKEDMIGRPYSFVNSPHTQPHEFYFITLPGGPLSPQLAALDLRQRAPKSPAIAVMDEVAVGGEELEVALEYGLVLGRDAELGGE